MFDPNLLNAFKGMALTIVLVVIWDLFWKGKGLWASARNSQKGWFIAILVINSVGILPIIYLLFFAKKSRKS